MFFASLYPKTFNGYLRSESSPTREQKIIQKLLLLVLLFGPCFALFNIFYGFLWFLPKDAGFVDGDGRWTSYRYFSSFILTFALIFPVLIKLSEYAKMILGYEGLKESESELIKACSENQILISENEALMIDFKANEALLADIFKKIAFCSKGSRLSHKEDADLREFIDKKLYEELPEKLRKAESLQYFIKNLQETDEDIIYNALSEKYEKIFGKDNITYRRIFGNYSSPNLKKLSYKELIKHQISQEFLVVSKQISLIKNKYRIY